MMKWTAKTKTKVTTTKTITKKDDHTKAQMNQAPILVGGGSVINRAYPV